VPVGVALRFLRECLMLVLVDDVQVDVLDLENMVKKTVNFTSRHKRK